MISGGILLWSGSIATIPGGFVLCDGNNGTPDLRNKFIVGAKEDDGGVAKSDIEGSLKQTGGDNDHQHNVSSYGSGNIDNGAGLAAGGDKGTTTTVSVSGTTDPADNIPPYFALAYIMKT